MTDYAHTSYAQAARERKAIRLEAAMRRGRFTAEEVGGFTVEQRRDAETIAGVRVSSDETWALVLRLMRDAEGHRG